MSVYGRKITIDGVEYVAVPEVGESCTGCALQGKCNTGKINHAASSLFINTFGSRCNSELQMILKKVEPKKKPEKKEPKKPNLTRRNIANGIIDLTTLDALLANSYKQPMSFSLFHAMNQNTQYIVCLSESGNLKPSETPHQHDSELAAIKEAQRLCKKHNQKFVVLKVVAEVEPEIQTKVTKR
jgi:hypothetical protein